MNEIMNLIESHNVKTIQWIKHRVNQIEALSAVDPAWGVEIDLRSSIGEPGKIHLSHDPWVRGDDFERWLERFVELKIQGPIILNTKEDALEARTLELLKQHQLTHYFFLDTAFPTLLKRSFVQSEPHFAVRLSKYEPLAGVRVFKGKASWAWVDCFHGEPLSVELVEQAKEDFKICLVSPELQSMPLEKIGDFLKLVPLCDAICTKQPKFWQNVLGG